MNDSCHMILKCLCPNNCCFVYESWHEAVFKSTTNIAFQQCHMLPIRISTTILVQLLVEFIAHKQTETLVTTVAKSCFFSLQADGCPESGNTN